MTFEAGQKVKWLYTQSGGWNFSWYVPATVIRQTTKRVLIEAELARGGTKQVWVTPERLKTLRHVWLLNQFSNNGIIPDFIREVVDVNDEAALEDLYTGLSRMFANDMNSDRIEYMINAHSGNGYQQA